MSFVKETFLFQFDRIFSLFELTRKSNNFIYQTVKAAGTNEK